MNIKRDLLVFVVISISVVISGCGNREEAMWVLVVDGRATKVESSVTRPGSDEGGTWKRVSLGRSEITVAEEYTSIDLNVTLNLRIVVVWSFDDPSRFATTGHDERAFRREYLTPLLSSLVLGVLVDTEEQIILGTLQLDEEQIESFAKTRLEDLLETEMIMDQKATEYFGFVIERIDTTAGFETI